MPVEVGSAVGYLKLDISGFKQSINEANKELSDGLDEAESTGNKKSKSIGSQIDSVGKALMKGATVPIMGAATASVKFAGDFESAMKKTSAISGATGKDLEALSNNAKLVGGKLKVSASEAAGAYEYMAMAGWETQDMLAGLEPIMTLSIATGTDLAQTSDIVTDALTAFGLTANDTSGFCDLLAKTSTSANTDVLKLGESFKYVAPVAGSLGYTAQDTAFALGIMANSGIKAGQAGTALRAALAHLEKPSETVATMMEKYGISLTTASGEMKPLKQLTDELRDKLGGLSEAERTTAIATLFGTEAQAGMSAIINATDKDYNTLYGNLSNCKDASAVMAETMRDSLKGELDGLKANVQNLAITFGEDLLPTVRSAIKWFSDLLGKFQSIPKPVRQIIEVLALCVAAIAPLISGVKMLGTAFTFLAANPIGVAITAIGAIGVALVTLWNTNEDFRKAILDIWGKVQKKVKEVSDALVKTYKSVSKELKKAWESMTADLKKAVDDMKDKYESAKKTAKEAWDSMKKTVSESVGGIVEKWKEFKENTIGKMKEVHDKVKEYIDKIKSFFDFSDEVKIVKDKFTEIKNGFSLKGAWENVKSDVQEVKDNLVNFLFGKGDNSLRATVRKGWENIKGEFSLSGAWRGIWDSLTEVRGKVWERLGSWNTPHSVYSYVKTGIENIKKAFKVELPHPTIKLPRIGWSGKFSLNPWEVPKFNITWNAKAMNNPYILDGATIFGAMGNKLLGGGETGRELIVGERMFLESIKKAMREILQSNDSFTEYSQKTLSDGLQSVTRALEKIANNTAKTEPSGGDTFVFNSPKAIDEVEAARQVEKIKEQLVFI
ncbi:MAG: phage tail tape measure protein [Clostridia bacterium]|nr:phage tail tape measure protein [Clostridia bacterium]